MAQSLPRNGFGGQSFGIGGVESGQAQEDGCATLNLMRTILAICLLNSALLLAQGKPAAVAGPAKAAAPEVVPVDQEPAHKLVFENEYVRVFSVEVAPHSETKYHRHERDYVGVILGDADVESVRLGEAAVSLKLKDGEARFTKGGFAHKAVNKSDKPFRNVTVELKKELTQDEIARTAEIAELVTQPARYMKKLEVGGIRVWQATKGYPNFAFSFSGFFRLVSRSKMLAIINFTGVASDHGLRSDPRYGAGCPCPTKRVSPGMSSGLRMMIGSGLTR